MNHYRSNLRDMAFNLFEVMGRSDVFGIPPYGDVDADAARSILEEADRYARSKLAESFSDVGRDGLQFDPDTHAVRMPKQFREAALDYIESGWLELDQPAEKGEGLVPPSLRWCVAELMLGANAPIPMGVNVMPQVVRLLKERGNEDQRRLADLIRERGWMVTMVLTEPDAGSDVGDARTRAVPRPDGTWHLSGVKRFITYGDHDLSDNIVHLVLARPSGVDGVGAPGTKGLSLFVVPKFLVDLKTGDCLDRNGVEVTGIEHKMGQAANPTCEVTFGDSRPAVGYLLGDTHAGIQQMFEILKHFRMLVGVKSMATASTAYLNAKAYAEERVQGTPIESSGVGEQERIPIIDHPDIRRSLMTQKAYAEGMRSLVLYAATQQDEVERAKALGQEAPGADKRHQLLLPVIKGYCAETAWRVMSQESLQVLGGSGYLQDYPFEQYLRDTKVDSLYEGTTGIQALDLLGRKIVRDHGATLDALLGEIVETSCLARDSGLDGGDLLATAVSDLRVMVEIIVARWNAPVGPDQGRAVAALDATRLLLRVGDLVCGWLLMRGAMVAQEALASALGTERDFYLGKVAAAEWFATTVLPGITAELAVVHSTTRAITELPRDAL